MSSSEGGGPAGSSASYYNYRGYSRGGGYCGYDYLAIVDFEANCIPKIGQDGPAWSDPRWQIPGFVSEIIEFPTVIVRRKPKVRGRYAIQSSHEQQIAGLTTLSSRRPSAALSKEDINDPSKASEEGANRHDTEEQQALMKEKTMSQLEREQETDREEEQLLRFDLSAEDWEVVDEFHSFVRPVRVPILTEFCKSLTGIKQEQVDTAEVFPVVFKKWQHFIGIQEQFLLFFFFDNIVRFHARERE